MEWSREIDGAIRVYTITVTVAPPEIYGSVFSGDEADIKTALDGPFLAKLNAAIAKELKRPVTGAACLPFSMPNTFRVFIDRGASV